MGQVTVYAVAARAGVSIATVSRVLNAPDKVNETTRTRVLSAIDELGFVPKAEAAARARKLHGRIGVLAPFFTYPSFVERLQGISNALDGSPYELVIYNVDSSARLVSYLATMPVTRRLDGLIIMALPFDDAAGERLITHDLPAVLIEFSHEPFSSIRIDDQYGGRLAAEYLLERGHRCFGFIGDGNVPDYALRTSDARLEGYRQVLASAGLELAPDYVGLAPHSRENAYRLAQAMLALPQPPTAIFAASDTQAMGVLSAARERGLAVPSDLAVIGFDDVEMADYVGLTTIRQHLVESGRVAVDLLFARLADPARPPQRVRLPLELIRRRSA